MKRVSYVWTATTVSALWIGLRSFAVEASVRLPDAALSGVVGLGDDFICGFGSGFSAATGIASLFGCGPCAVLSVASALAVVAFC